jgi:hypothetical protein
MFSACIDIAFLENLTQGGFGAGYFVIAADDPLFWQGRDTGGIYAPFRNGSSIRGTIRKPTGTKNVSLTLTGEYFVNWQGVSRPRYAAVEVGGSNKRIEPTA